MEPPIDLDLLFSRLESDAGGEPRQLRLYRLIRGAILDGTLAAGTRLPGTRALAADLGIARNSVLYAYERLSAEGFLGADRHGTRVLPLPRTALAGAGKAPRAAPSARARRIATANGGSSCGARCRGISAAWSRSSRARAGCN